jgi:hypothetical protein
MRPLIIVVFAALALTACSAEPPALRAGDSVPQFALATPAPASQPAPPPAAEPVMPVAATGAGLPPILTRPQWNARPPLPGMIAQRPRSIVIHNTAVKRNFARSLAEKLRNLQSFSQTPQTGSGPKRDAWPDIPYHYYIDARGNLGEGREVAFRGDSNTRYSLDGHIQVVVEGDFDTETPSAEQIGRLTDLIVALQKKYGVPKTAIKVHNDLAPTTCPGKSLKAIVYNDILPKLPG